MSRGNPDSLDSKHTNLGSSFAKESTSDPKHFHNVASGGWNPECSEAPVRSFSCQNSHHHGMSRAVPQRKAAQFMLLM